MIEPINSPIPPPITINIIFIRQPLKQPDPPSNFPQCPPKYVNFGEVLKREMMLYFIFMPNALGHFLLHSKHFLMI